MARPRNPIIQWPLTTLCIAFGAVTASLPSSLCRMLGALLGRLAYWGIPRVRTVSLGNLELAFGNTLSRGEKVRIAKGAARNVGIVAAEFARIGRITPEFVASHVIVKGTEYLDRERGGLLIGAHISNWEWMAPILRTLHDKVAVVVRPMNDLRLDAYVDRMRRSNGVVTIPKEGAGAEILRLMREGYLVGVLVDQSPRDNAAPVQFFARPCWGTIAPVMAAFRARAPVYAATLTRDAKGDYAMEFTSPIEFTRSGDLRADLVANSQKCQAIIETFVRNCPEQWLWLHRRWKPRSRLEDEWRRRLGRTRREE